MKKEDYAELIQEHFIKNERPLINLKGADKNEENNLLNDLVVVFTNKNKLIFYGSSGFTKLSKERVFTITKKDIYSIELEREGLIFKRAKLKINNNLIVYGNAKNIKIVYDKLKK